MGGKRRPQCSKRSKSQRLRREREKLAKSNSNQDVSTVSVHEAVQFLRKDHSYTYVEKEELNTTSDKSFNESPSREACFFDGVSEETNSFMEVSEETNSFMEVSEDTSSFEFETCATATDVETCSFEVEICSFDEVTDETCSFDVDPCSSAEVTEETCSFDVETCDSDEMLPPLTVYTEKLRHGNPPPNNRVICNMYSVIEQARELERHSYGGCQHGGTFVFERERKMGLIHEFVYKCSKHICSAEMKIRSDPEENSLNHLSVLATLSTGSGFALQEEQFCTMNMEYMSQSTFSECEKITGNILKSCAEDTMTAAIENEKDLARQRNEIDSDGYCNITAIVDGGWCKRTYGHGYNASSGVAVVIGERTKQILFIGVRNKVCLVCQAIEKKRIPPREHICFRNWKSHSTAMESDIIVEGLRYLHDVHKIRCVRLIGDGDSNTMCKVKARVSFGGIVRKVECANHAVRRYGRRLEALTKDAKTYPAPNGLAARQALKTRLSRLVVGARTAIKRHEVTNPEEVTRDSIENLKKELLNGPTHVFGDHSACADFCNRKECDPYPPVMAIVMNPGMLTAIEKAVDDALIFHASTLILNATNNPAEAYFGQLAKTNGGKRVDHSRAGGINRRSHVAALAFQSRGQGWHANVHRSITKSSVPKILSTFISRRNRNLERLRIHRQLMKRRERRQNSYIPAGGDENYGDAAAQPEIIERPTDLEKQEFFEKLKVERNDELEEETRGQSDCLRWHEERTKRLSATSVKKVVSRRPATPTKSLVKSIVYGTDQEKLKNIPAILHGKENEDTALEEYANKHAPNVPVRKCGLFVCVSHPYICASPDGLVSDDGLVEIKCLFTAESYDTILECCLAKNEKGKPKHDIGLKIGKDGQLFLPQSHKYFFQIQCQMEVTGRSWCDLFFWTRKDSQVFRFMRNKVLWNSWLSKLEPFFFDCLLPELINSRKDSPTEYVEPNYVIEAIMAKKTTQDRTANVSSETANV